MKRCTVVLIGTVLALAACSAAPPPEPDIEGFTAHLEAEIGLPASALDQYTDWGQELCFDLYHAEDDADARAIINEAGFYMMDLGWEDYEVDFLMSAVSTYLCPDVRFNVP
jgi:hypothetical protein